MPEGRLSFIIVGNTGKTLKWAVSKGDLRLGEIEWYAAWRRYCFFPHGSTLFDSSCLKEIVDFIDSAMAARKGTA